MTRQEWIVVGIMILILLGLGLSFSVSQGRNCRRTLANAIGYQRETLDRAIRQYEKDHHALPAKLDDLLAARTVGTNSAPYLFSDKLLKDPHGSAVTYRAVGATNYILSSPDFEWAERENKHQR